MRGNQGRSSIEWAQGCAVALALVLCGSNISGQVNSWTKSGNGYWEEPFWTLGVPPSSSQSAIQFTNGGYKALAIGASTRNQYPQTLTISNLEVSAPADSGNLLLMNYSGLDVPLRVLNNFHIGANGHLLHLYALLRIEGLNGGGFFVDGIARHAEFASLIANRVVIGSEWVGEYHLTNGTFTTSNLMVGVGAAGTFSQWGGVVEITSELDLGPNTFAGPASARGDYWLHGGMMSAPVLDGRRGTFAQLGGTNSTGILHMGDAKYELVAGLLITGNLDLSSPPGTGMQSRFVQHGGNHRCSGWINLGHSSGSAGAEYQLDAGQLSASSARITWWSRFTQNGGTNSLGYLQLDQPNAQYHLNGGLLASEGCRVGVFGYPEPEVPSIIQNGGVHRVSDQLILEDGAYALKGGTLNASNIILWVGELRLQGGVVIHSGRIEMARGILAPEQGNTIFGPLVLSTNPILGSFASSRIEFSAAPATIRFADSSAVTWPNGNRLAIRNWAGLLRGGGKHQIRFGNNASGLSAQQLSQVRFANPGGLPAGNYTARLLPDGEAVPDLLDLRGFSYVANSRGVTITHYDCSENVLTIPSMINGQPVTTIADYAFEGCLGLGVVIIPDTVTSIGFAAFRNCTALTEVVIGNRVMSIGGMAFAYCAALQSVTIPDSVTSIWGYAFQYCYNLTNAIIGDGVTNIAFGAFSDCGRLTAMYFRGHAPRIDIVVFNVGRITVFYLPGTLGWGSEFAGAPTALWRLPYPVILDLPPNFGVQANRFGFIASWATNASVVIETSTSLGNPAWSPLATNALGTAGWSYFSDTNSRNYPARFYRLRQF
jgi:hypothetical protein